MGGRPACCGTTRPLSKSLVHLPFSTRPLSKTPCRLPSNLRKGRPPLAPTGIAAHCDAHPSACGGWRCERTDGEATVAELTGQPATLLHLSIAFLVSIVNRNVDPPAGRVDFVDCSIWSHSRHRSPPSPLTRTRRRAATQALRCCVWCWKRRRRQQAATQGVDDGGHPGVQEAVAAPVAPAAAIEPGGG
jgi:hypothetical protein